ncbi:MAG: hypothetical protein Q9225_006432 [Loekoesia sp. 1 TL-2023]
MFVQHAILWLLTVVSLAHATPTRVIHLPVASAVGGDASPDDSTCNDYKTCSSKGHRDWQELMKKVSEAQPVDKTGSKAVFDDDYGCSFMSSDDPVPSVRDDLEGHGFEWDWIEAFGVYSKNPQTGEDSEETAYTNMFYTSKGLIVADENYRQKDEQKTLHWSELMYQAWQVAKEHDDVSKAANIPPGHPGGGDISKLQTVVRVSVQNDQAKEVIGTIRAAKQGWNPGDETWHKFTVAEDTANWFYALLGTVNVQSVVWLLRDHAAEIGKKIITEIWVRWDSVDPDIWINIGPPT